MLPFAITTRTLASYEQGTVRISALRLIEIGHVLGVDLRSLLTDSHTGVGRFRPMAQWARNALNDNRHGDGAGVVELEPAVVRNLALFVGCEHGGSGEPSGPVHAERGRV